MDDPAVLVLLLEQGDRSLEDHTTDFVFLTNYTHYPDNCLCSFYFAGLNTTTRAQLSGDGPRESFAAYVEWVLVSCNSSLTVDFADDDTSPTLDPEPSLPSPQFAEHEPEPTVDGEPEPSVTESSPCGATGLRIAQEPEPLLSDQVREPATEPATVDIPDGREGAEDSTAHCTTTEGEQHLDLGLIFLEQDLTNFVEDIYEDMPALLPPSELPDNLEQDLINFSEDVYEDMPALLPPSKLPDCLDFPPTLPLSIVSAASVPPPLCPGNPSAHPQPTISAVGSLQVCQSPSVSWLEDPSSPPPASVLRPSGSTPALSSLISTVARWPTSSTGLPRPSGSTLVGRCPAFASGLRSSSSASSLHPTGSVGLLPPSSSTFVLGCSCSALDLRSSASASTLRILGVALDYRLSVSTSGSTSTCSATVSRPPGVVSSSSTMAPPSVGSTVGRHDGCGLGLAWLLLLRVPPEFSLAPPSVVTTLDFVYCPPPRSPSATRASSHYDFISTPFPCREIYMKGSGKLQYDSKTALRIPPRTVMAYSVIKMTVESDGYIDLSSGLESDDISQNTFPNFSEVDGQWPQMQEGLPLTTLKKALADVHTRFCALADMSAESRSPFLLLLKENLTDRSVLSALVDRLEQLLSSCEAPCFSPNELSENQRKIVDAFTDLLMHKQLEKSEPSASTSLASYNGCPISTSNHSDSPLTSELNGSSSRTDEQNGCHASVSRQNGCSTKASRQSMELTYVMQMLINALEELTDEGLQLLKPFCTSEGLQSLQNLVMHLTTSDMPLCENTRLVFLQTESEFHRVEQLFKSCNVLLSKENDTLTSEITCKEEFLPVVLCIAIHGLASLVSAPDAFEAYKWQRQETLDAILAGCKHANASCDSAATEGVSQCRVHSISGGV
ncbi:Gasdermin-E [Labeo rohita]|uniref:Gasdermin-E n=1 Tax=Labeo rohita TaxID=84645 RepID=A0ABQ8LQP3_LABRO|nr:Gasdermin-E [Labeo rohita]